MSRLRLVKIATPTTPATNKGEIFYSSTLSPATLAFIDESGNVLRLGGLGNKDYRLVKYTTILNGTTSYTPTSGVAALDVICIGGGGAGGGAASSTAGTNNSIGGGGGGGGWARSWVTTNVSGSHGSIAVGAGGTQGTAGNNPGNAGGDTTFTDNTAAAQVVGKGGSGGPGGGASGTVVGAVVAGGAGGVTGTGDRTGQGSDGGWSLRFSVVAATGMLSGPGGVSGLGFGSGGAAIQTSGAGNSGRVYGGGGSGGADAASTNRQGGVGANGIIYIGEYA